MWDTAQPAPDGVQAVGTATKASSVEFGAWSTTGMLLMGGATATDDRRITVHTA